MFKGCSHHESLPYVSLPLALETLPSATYRSTTKVACHKRSHEGIFALVGSTEIVYMLLHLLGPLLSLVI